MARLARKRSKTGIYHIMLRGIDKRNIFLDDEDRMKFIEKLMKAKKIADFKLFGYCLMDNHVHLLIEEKEEIGISIKRITVGYVQWHNNKNGRTGHLFQNRYISEPVEMEGYLLNVVRYIHQNPVKAKIIKNPKEYPWSSYHQYICSYQEQKSEIDTELIKSYFSRQEDFEDYMNTQNDDKCLEYNPGTKYSDTMLRNTVLSEIDINRLKEISIEERNKKIKQIYMKTGASIRQLERVLGIGKTVIQKAVK